MMIRHSHEYGYKIQAFHHALEAWRVADMIHYENISTALFADNWGYKKEAYESSVHAAELLTAAGVKVAFKSDHPVLNAQVIIFLSFFYHESNKHLIFEAQKAHFYGLDAKSAIKSVTSISAENIGATHRIGSVAPGYDADLVIWNTHPLILGATPLRVFVDGYETFRHPTHDAIMKDAMHDNEEKVESYEEVKNLNFECMDSSSRNVVLTNISSIYASESVHLVGSLRIIIADGIIECFGSDSDCHASTTTHQINMQRGVIIPGLVLGMSHLGLEEITSEQRTSNGVSRVDVLKSGGTRAADGLRVGLDGSKVQKSAYFGGVTRSVSVPRGSGVVLGQATHFILGVDGI